MADDTDGIRAEAERRKHRASQLGLPDLTTRFYREFARFYPAWVENQPALLPALVRDVRKTDEHGVEFVYEGHRYSLAWAQRRTTMPDGDVYSSATLSLLFDGTRVLELYLQGEFSEYSGTEWRPMDTRGFIEGQWIGPLQTLAREAERLHSEYQQHAEDDRRRQEAKNLRERFGIDENPAPQGGAPAMSLAARLGMLVGRLLRSPKE